jgi:hypothetical protein
MTIGQILSDTWDCFKGRFGTLLVLWAIYFGITIVLFIVMSMAMGAASVASLAALSADDPFSTGGSLAALGGVVVFVVLFYLVYLLVMMAQYASMIVAASPARRVDFSEALGSGWRAAPPLLLLMVMLIAVYFAVSLAAGGIVGALAQSGEGAVGLLGLLLLPLLVWLGCRLAPLFAIVAVDGVRNPFKAIARSWHLTRGHALTIFGASLAFMVLLLLVCGVLLLPSLGLLLGPGGQAAGPDEIGQALGSFALLMLALLAISALFTMSYSAFLAVLHARLRDGAGEGAAEAFA